MKLIATVLATALFAGTASAASIYNGFQVGNPDLQTAYTGGSPHVTAMPHGVGTDIDRYQGWDKSNPDLFGGEPDTMMSSHVSRAGVYGGFAGSPDL